MKKIFFSLAFLLIGSFALANNPSVLSVDSDEINFILKYDLIFDSNKKGFKEDEIGRQCCSKTTYMADGTSVTISACAGWFLSDDANAMTRACDKVNKAMGID